LYTIAMSTDLNSLDQHSHFRWHRFQGVLFDLDGLLVDSERISRDCWLAAAQERGFDLTDTYPQLVGRGAAETDRILTTVLGSAEIVALLRARKSELFDLHVEHRGVPLKPGAQEILSRSKELGLKTALATGSMQAAAQQKLAAHSIRHLFDAEVFGADVQRGKPYPDIFLLAAQKITVAPESCLVLEDSVAGMTAAHAAQMRVVVVPDLVHVPHPETTETVLVVNSLHEADRILSLGEPTLFPS
jgi:HAD superfamily hydrolase (TIGR01509 family)